MVRTWCVLYILTWTGNVLRATMACIFSHISTSKSGSKVKCFLDFWLWNVLCATRAVQLFISHLARWLRTRCFSEPTFRPSRATNHWKKQSESWLFYLFAPLHLLSSDSFSSLTLFLLFFSSLALPTCALHLSIILSEGWLQNFFRSLLCILSASLSAGSV